MKLLEGAPVAKYFFESIKKKIDSLNNSPRLHVFLVGNDPASQIYVKMKQKRAQEVGIEASLEHLSEDISEEELLQRVDKANKDPKIHGILVQLPLPKKISTHKILDNVSPSKDVDGLHPLNMGKLALGRSDGFIPCTPRGIYEILKFYKVPIEGKKVAIIGRSAIVGRPLSLLLSQAGANKNATVTLLHSRSENLQAELLSADIIIAAVGSPQIIKKEMVKEGAFVIDVGVNRIPDDSPKGYKIVGDVDFDAVKEHVSGITPVPRGVGPMTIAMLLQNTLEAAL